MFLAFPVVYTLYLSFFEYHGVGEGFLFAIDLGVFAVEVPRISNVEFVGLENYTRMVGDGLFWLSMWNTVIITVFQMPLMVLVSLGVALALNASFIKLSGLQRTLIALPVSANFVAYSTIFLMIFSEQFGLANYVIQLVGFEPIAWQSDRWWARVMLAITLDWRWMGYNMLILFAGLQNIPGRLYEAAEIDGASAWQKFRYVTVPQLKPMLLFVIVLSTVGSMQLFSEPFIITEGGPSNSTITILYYIYDQAFVYFNLGYASALTYVLVGVVTALSIIEMKIGGED
ncbi:MULTISPECIES: sugar ABC transporter permease [Natrialba]|uniref:carbohydrate ABC transporter permease n=1 Tax=Natrialba TaxID=63742 RepID=UPI00190F2E19|nr:sugar ABC transporter permease [Natrialba swarupiae]